MQAFLQMDLGTRLAVELASNESLRRRANLEGLNDRLLEGGREISR